jgi:hypothetical protein
MRLPTGGSRLLLGLDVGPRIVELFDRLVVR